MGQPISTYTELKISTGLSSEEQTDRAERYRRILGNLNSLPHTPSEDEVLGTLDPEVEARHTPPM